MKNCKGHRAEQIREAAGRLEAYLLMSFNLAGAKSDVCGYFIPFTEKALICCWNIWL